MTVRRAGGTAARKPGRKPAPKPANRRKRGSTSASLRPRFLQSELPPRARAILDRLKQAYPEASCALEHEDPYQLIVATILSAQCTDARVNLVTPEFFRRYAAPASLARARQPEVETVIRSTGFFRNKARNLIAMAQALVAEHGGAVPRTMEQLYSLPGVGRKTANVVLGNAFGLNEGVTVDTHVARLSQLLKLTQHSDPVKIEQDLMRLIPREDWTLVSHLLIFHGRQICIARRPRCGECVLATLCPSARVTQA